jgi:Leucine-rich repeat (LRR) protein
MIVLLCNCEKGDPFVKFADDEFLDLLISRGIDVNEDGKISYDEAEAVHILNISYESLKDVSGIQAFKNVDTLICDMNLLTTLDVSNMKNLVYLNCYMNNLTSLDIGGNIQLRT